MLCLNEFERSQVMNRMMRHHQSVIGPTRNQRRYEVMLMAARCCKSMWRLQVYLASILAGKPIGKARGVTMFKTWDWTACVQRGAPCAADCIVQWSSRLKRLWFHRLHRKDGTAVYLSESPRVIVPFLQQHRLLGRTVAVLSFNLYAGTGPYRS